MASEDELIKKYKGELRHYDFDMSPLLGSNESLTGTPSISQSEYSGTGSTNLTINNVTTKNGDTVQAEISDGSDGVTYKLVCEADTDNGNTLQMRGFLEVIEA